MFLQEGVEHFSPNTDINKQGLSALQLTGRRKKRGRGGRRGGRQGGESELKAEVEAKEEAGADAEEGEEGKEEE